MEATQPAATYAIPATALSEPESLWTPESESLARLGAPESSPLRTPPRGAGQSVNVHALERLGSALLGGFLVARGLTERSRSSKVLAVLGSSLVYRGVSGHCHLYGRLGVDTAHLGHRETGSAATASGKHEVERSVTIGKSPEELYRFFRRAENLDRIVGHFAEVSAVTEDRMRWRVRGPSGRTHEWETRIIEDIPGQLLRWESVEGALVANVGKLRLRPAPGGRGTEVSLELRFDPPGGVIGDAVVKALGPAPALLVGRALRNFKNLIEAGEIPSLTHNPAARPSENV